MLAAVQFALDGLLVGGSYALLAAGLAMIFGVVGIINFAQADFMMLAMFLVFVLWSTLRLDPLLVVPIAFITFMLLGMMVYRLLLAPLTGRRANHEAQMLLTLGLGILLQSAARFAFPGVPKLVRSGYAGEGWRLGPLFIDATRLLSFVVAVGVIGALFLFLNRTTLGRAIRATSENWESATYMGIDVARTYQIAFGLGLALSAVGGVMLSTFQSIHPAVGTEYIVILFVAVVLGGVGSITGALLGGIVIGLVQTLSQLWSSAEISGVWVFALLLVVLYVRPRGLLARSQRGI